jgi:uncharacterized protein with NRDE domain
LKTDFVMCILAIAFHVHPQFPLIIASNRDEFVARPTQPLAPWEDDSGIVAGRDLEAGGTWLGVNRERRVAALTNFRDPSESGLSKRSRGELVVAALRPDQPIDAALQACASQRAAYRGFNLVVADSRSCSVYESRSDRLTTLVPGVHALSNGPLDSMWPKTARLQRAVNACVSKRDILADDLLDALSNTEVAPDEQLPHTGISAEWERALSRIFIPTVEGYGTRAQTLVFVGHDHARIVERDVASGRVRDVTI